MHMMWSYVTAGALIAGSAAAVVHGEVGALEVRFIDAATSGLNEGLAVVADELLGPGTPSPTSATPAHLSDLIPH